MHAAFNLVRLSVPLMTDGGSIINTASVQSKKPTPNILPYAATKGALANLTIGLAGVLAEKNIRVNAVLPGPIWTPFIPSGMDEESVENFGGQTPWAPGSAGRAGIGVCHACGRHGQLHLGHLADHLWRRGHAVTLSHCCRARVADRATRAFYWATSLWILGAH